MMDEGRKRRMHQSEHPVAAVVFSLAWILLYAVERNRVDCRWGVVAGCSGDSHRNFEHFHSREEMAQKCHRNHHGPMCDRFLTTVIGYRNNGGKTDE